MSGIHYDRLEEHPNFRRVVAAGYIYRCDAACEGECEGDFLLKRAITRKDRVPVCGACRGVIGV